MDRLMIIFVLVGFLAYVLTLDFLGPKEKILTVRKLENCKGTNFQIKFQNVKVSRDPTTKLYKLSLNVVIKEEVSTAFSMTFDFLKCDTSGNPDSCEFLFKDHRIDNVCKYLGMKDQPWSEFVGYFDKEIKCPIKAGTYKLVDLLINPRTIDKIPVSDAVWKLHIGGYEPGRKIACVDADVQVLTVRKT